MSARSTHNYRQDGNNKGSNRAPMKYVARTKNPSTQQPFSIPKPNPNPSLTSSLRETDPSATSSTSSTSSTSRVRVGDNGNWISSRNHGGNFVNYLPQDEAVATGLGAEDGALDPLESQRVVDLLNRELSRLLKLNPKDFWREVTGDTSLHEFLDSFLQFRKRWYDFPHHGANGLVAGVVIGELELTRRVFMVLYRISSNRDPGARASDSLSANEHAVLLQEKKLLDLPKLIDVCAVYGHENEELTRLLVANAMQAQPLLRENLSAVVSRFLSVVQTMHQRCDSLLETVHSSGGHDDHGEIQLHADFSEVMDFINDGVASLDAFVNAYRPAALYFSCPVEMSYGSGELLGTLARLHDSLLPSLRRGFGLKFTAEDGSQNSCAGSHPEIANSLKILSMRILTFFWKLLDLCYLSNEIFEGSLPLQTVTKMFPFSVEDPAIRGDILVQTFREINEEASRHGKENKSSGTLLQKVQNINKVLSRLDELRASGWILMDAEQFQYITLLLMPPADTVKKDFHVSAPMGNKVQMDENAAIMESKISQIKDLFPDYGKGFLAACLEVYNQNPEEVIQRILEGTLHKELQSMDISLAEVPPPKSASSLGRSDKGKGLAQVTSPSKVVAAVAARQTEGPSSSVSSSPLAGRFTRKTRVDLPNPDSLDTRAYEESTKTALLASQYEYEDEYDDSFDDLGLSVVESGYEETENMGVKSAPGKSWGSETESQAPNNSGPKWNARKTPQFYVKDGKNYSYKVSGSVAVGDSREAALVNQAQKEMINGLGRGGNLPLGAVKTLTESNERRDQDQNADGSDMGGRGGGPGGPRGRGRRGGGGRNHNRKDRATKKHFAGLGGF